MEQEKKKRLTVESTLLLTAFFGSLAVVVAGVVCWILKVL